MLLVPRRGKCAKPCGYWGCRHDHHRISMENPCRQDYQWKHEPCYYGWKSGAAHTWNNDRKQTTVLEFDRPIASPEHPTMKPVALFEYLIRNSSKKGDIVLDLFAGSGTTMIAAEQNGRTAYLMEIDPYYCDVILTRWENLTGERAERL